MTSSLPSSLRLDDIYEELQECETATERLEYLVELGETLPPFPADECIEANRVLGCQSAVWLVASVEGDRVTFVATSDAPMVRGLIAILIAAYSGRTAREILDFDIESFFAKIALQSFITPMRSNGLHSMVLRVRSISQAVVAANERASGNLPAAIARPKHASTRSLSDAVKDFPILQQLSSSGQRLVYLDNAASSQRPRQVLEAMQHVYTAHYSNVHRSGHWLAAKTTQAMEQARQAIADFVNAASADEIIFTPGTTASINLVARSWGEAHLKPGDEIVLSEMEHHSNIVPWQQLAQRTGAKLRWIPFDEAFEIDLEAFEQTLSPRVKLVAMTAVSNVLGTLNPIAKISSMAHAHGSLVLVDAAQAVPHGGVDVQTLGADWVAFSGHKMLGPTGIGVLYGRRELLEHMPPFLGGGNMIHSVSRDGFVPAASPHRFEAGTPPIVEAIAMKSAVEYLNTLGEGVILEHEQKLVAAVHDRLEQYPSIRILGPSPAKKSGLFTFTIDGLHADEIGRRLDALGIAVRVGHHCAMPLHQRLGLTASCRASFYLYNTEEDADRFCEAVESCLTTRAR